MSDSCPPLFIVGLGRSGSTLVSRMIDAHRAAAIFPETHMFGVLDFVGALENFGDRWQHILFLNEVWANLAAYPLVAGGAPEVQSGKNVVISGA